MSDRIITAVAVEVTTVCNLKCAHCICEIGRRPAVHHPIEYFREAARWIHGIDRVDVTGGEPTCHPLFADIALRFRNLFGCKRLTLETNGFKALKYDQVLCEFDLIRLSRYGGNDEVIDWILDNYTSYVQNGSTCGEISFDGADALGHIPRDRRGAGGPCNLGTCEFVAYADGRFYPCRVGPGIPGAASLEPCADWRERILDVPLPCSDCPFSP